MIGNISADRSGLWGFESSSVRDAGVENAQAEADDHARRRSLLGSASE